MSTQYSRGDEISYSVQGFADPNPGGRRTLSDVLSDAPAESILLRITTFPNPRPVTKRRRRLCERGGHPRSRLQPVYRGWPTPMRFTANEEEVSFDIGNVSVDHQYCLRCGRDVVPL